MAARRTGRLRPAHHKREEKPISTATIEQPATATEAPTVRFRRNAKQEWVLFGPAAMVTIGPVTVTKKDGKTTIEKVLGLGDVFDKDGVSYRYGYLKPKAEEKPAKPASEDDYVPDDFVPEYDDSDTSDTDY